MVDPAIGNAHVKCVRAICANSQSVKSHFRICSRAVSEGRGGSGFRPCKGRNRRGEKLGEGA